MIPIAALAALLLAGRADAQTYTPQNQQPQSVVIAQRAPDDCFAIQIASYTAPGGPTLVASSGTYILGSGANAKTYQDDSKKFLHVAVCNEDPTANIYCGPAVDVSSAAPVAIAGRTSRKGLTVVPGNCVDWTLSEIAALWFCVNDGKGALPVAEAEVCRGK